MAEAALPEAERMFERFVAPHYPDDGPAGQLRADAEQGLLQNGGPDLEPELRDASQAAFAEMREAALGDLAEFLQVEAAETSLESIDAVDRFWTPGEVTALAARTAADTGEQDEYLLTAIELGIVLGEALRGLVPACEWIHDWPYWESAIHHPPTGDVVNVFHWAVNKLSASGVNESLVLKLESCAAELRRGA
ncbi:MAG: hypothetical protein ACYTGX_02675 [Planctomycetota bacterium]|jgi:hypothetical protein